MTTKTRTKPLHTECRWCHRSTYSRTAAYCRPACQRSHQAYRRAKRQAHREGGL